MDIIVPKGHNVVVCKNERQRAVTGGEVTVTLLHNPEENTFVGVIEDHVVGTTKATPILRIRELEVLRDVVNDLLWKAKVK